ncbi:MAG: hypothetical protein R3F56_20390 [Planctomycetota bacterium]
MRRALAVLTTFVLSLALASVTAVALWRDRLWRRRLEAAPRQASLASSKREIPEVVAGVGAELATLASGIEGTAQLLLEAVCAEEPCEHHAEHLCAAVRRLRTLSETIQSAVGTIDIQPAATRIDDVVASVQQELVQSHAGRFRVVVDLASSAPEVHVDPRVLRQALLLLAEVVFRREPGASKVTLRTRNALDEQAHAVVVEMTAEVEENAPAGCLDDPRVALAHRAAGNLLTALGAEWTLHVNPGVEALASIALPAAEFEAAPAEASRQPEPVAHEFGGALVFESNPAVRHMVGQELERTGRQVFLCADGMSARTLWRATPDRFELLVVEATSGQTTGEELLVEALAQQPDLRALLLGRTEQPILATALAEPRARIATVPPPFGMMELRDALAHIGIANTRAAS